MRQRTGGKVRLSVRAGKGAGSFRELRAPSAGRVLRAGVPLAQVVCRIRRVRNGDSDGRIRFDRLGVRSEPTTFCARAATVSSCPPAWRARADPRARARADSRARNQAPANTLPPPPLAQGPPAHPPARPSSRLGARARARRSRTRTAASRARRATSGARGRTWPTAAGPKGYPARPSSSEHLHTHTHMHARAHAHAQRVIIYSACSLSLPL